MGPAGDDAADAELNIIPYLDIIMNLVIFLIFSFEVVLENTQIDVPAPAYSAVGGGGEQSNSLSVFVHSSGYDIVPVVTGVDGLSGKETIPLKNGQYDTAELTKALERLDTQFNFGPDMLITADPKIAYKTIVETMDAARNDSKGKELFPLVALSEAVQGG
jgi:biopolymer transport protein ExbD